MNSFPPLVKIQPAQVVNIQPAPTVEPLKAPQYVRVAGQVWSNALREEGEMQEIIFGDVQDIQDAKVPKIFRLSNRGKIISWIS